MNLFVVVRMGVYDRGIVGVYDNKIDAKIGLQVAKNWESDNHHSFEIRGLKLNQTLDFNCDDPYDDYNDQYYHVKKKIINEEK